MQTHTSRLTRAQLVAIATVTLALAACSRDARSATATSADSGGGVGFATSTQSVAASVAQDRVEAKTLVASRPAGAMEGAPAASPAAPPSNEAAPRLDIGAPLPGLLGALRTLGKVETVTASAEDVGEEYVDLGARVANARRVEARLVEMLATRTGKLSDVLTVEQELARVRQEIDSALACSS